MVVFGGEEGRRGFDDEEGRLQGREKKLEDTRATKTPKTYPKVIEGKRKQKIEEEEEKEGRFQGEKTQDTKAPKASSNNEGVKDKQQQHKK